MTLNTLSAGRLADVDAVDAAGDANLLVAEVEHERLGRRARIFVVVLAAFVGAGRAESPFEIRRRERRVELRSRRRRICRARRDSAGPTWRFAGDRARRAPLRRRDAAWPAPALRARCSNSVTNLAASCCERLRVRAEQLGQRGDGTRRARDAPACRGGGGRFRAPARRAVRVRARRPGRSGTGRRRTSPIGWGSRGARCRSGGRAAGGRRRFPSSPSAGPKASRRLREAVDAQAPLPAHWRSRLALGSANRPASKPRFARVECVVHRLDAPVARAERRRRRAAAATGRVARRCFTVCRRDGALDFGDVGAGRQGLRLVVERRVADREPLARPA